MKYLFYLFLMLTTSFAQNASDYFPSDTGHLWFFERKMIGTDYDSVTAYEIDSFAVTTNHYGQNAKVILAKTGPIQTVDMQPYLDSSFVNFDGAIGKEYVKINTMSFEVLFDSMGQDNPFGEFDFAEYLSSFEDWYDVYQFDAAAFQPYQIFSADTTLMVDTVEIPLRFDGKIVRLSDERISTNAGSFDTKKFVKTFTLSYLLIMEPLPPVPIKLMGIPDTVWIAENEWIIKEVTPSSVLNLAQIDQGSYTLPGLFKILTNPLTSVDESETNIPTQFTLEQNYPNPFNPATMIRFTLPEQGFVELSVYTLTGELVTTLVNNYLGAGEHSIRFDAGKHNLTSGVYVYQLKANDFLSSKKMLYMK